MFINFSLENLTSPDESVTNIVNTVLRRTIITFM